MRLLFKVHSMTKQCSNKCIFIIQEKNLLWSEKAKPAIISLKMFYQLQNSL